MPKIIGKAQTNERNQKNKKQTKQIDCQPNKLLMTNQNFYQYTKNYFKSSEQQKESEEQETNKEAN